jgi:predicted HTH domain antitoxin
MPLLRPPTVSPMRFVTHLCVMQGVAEQESTRKRSEGEATAKVELARAEKVSLDTIAEAIETDGCSQTEFMISKKYVSFSRAHAHCNARLAVLIYMTLASAGTTICCAQVPQASPGKPFSCRMRCPQSLV